MKSENVLRIDPENKDISWLIKKSEQSQKFGRDAYEYYEKGYRAYKEENFTEAIENFKQSISLNVDFKESHYYLALVFYKLADFDQSIEQWKKTIELDPFDNSAKHFFKQESGGKRIWQGNLKIFSMPVMIII